MKNKDEYFGALCFGLLVLEFWAMGEEKVEGDS